MLFSCYLATTITGEITAWPRGSAIFRAQALPSQPQFSSFGANSTVLLRFGTVSALPQTVRRICGYNPAVSDSKPWKRLMNRYAFFCTLLLVAGASTSASAGERVYKWVDADGVVHFGQQPPPSSEAEAEAIKVRKGYSTPDTDEPAQLTEEQKLAAEYAERCSIAQRNFEMLGSGTDIKQIDEYGEERILSAEEKAAQKDKAKTAMDRYCAPTASAKPAE